MTVIHFNMIQNINTLLKLDGYERISSVGACSCEGIRMHEVEEERIQAVVKIINQYLKQHYMYLIRDDKDRQIFHPETILKSRLTSLDK